MKHADLSQLKSRGSGKFTRSLYMKRWGNTAISIGSGSNLMILGQDPSPIRLPPPRKNDTCDVFQTLPQQRKKMPRPVTPGGASHQNAARAREVICRHQFHALHREQYFEMGGPDSQPRTSYVAARKIQFERFRKSSAHANSSMSAQLRFPPPVTRQPERRSGSRSKSSILRDHESGRCGCRRVQAFFEALADGRGGSWEVDG